ncbi:hypothetical protein V6N11_040278 [Hibiscus sabdariffa]|uniref:Uncharacterized protein n=1 Tax=Hibiscus sabdariffa TaxID=183260 RepID=A0ABR2RH20_9ROSI
MFTGTVTLRWSAGNLNRLSEDIGSPIHDDLDVLEMKEREKAVKHMWDVYTNSRRIRLPRFWQEVFEAAYEELASDVPGVREAAITEIAKMSVRYVDLDPPPIQSMSVRELSKGLKQALNGGSSSREPLAEVANDVKKVAGSEEFKISSSLLYSHLAGAGANYVFILVRFIIPFNLLLSVFCSMDWAVNRTDKPS